MFIGGHLAQRLAGEGHEVVLVARGSRRDQLERLLFVSDLSDPVVLAEAFKDCEVVAHCAGINRELGTQTFQRVHIEGTSTVIAAARTAGVRKVVLMSFLRARPNCGSPYHESKWEAEEILRNSALEFTVVRSGMVYGPGDHMLDHLSRALYIESALPSDSLPYDLQPTIGFTKAQIRLGLPPPGAYNLRDLRCCV